MSLLPSPVLLYLIVLCSTRSLPRLLVLPRTAGILTHLQATHSRIAGDNHLA